MQPSYPQLVNIPLTPQATVQASLSMPGDPKGVIIFSLDNHLEQSGQPHNKVRDYLLHQGFATLQYDLLTKKNADLVNQFDIRQQAEQLIVISEWLMLYEKTRGLHQAFYGAGIGAAVAIYAAAAEGSEMAAIVSVSGRPELAVEVLPTLQTPTLLMVGGEDREVLQANRNAMPSMHCYKRLEMIPGASPLFEERGAMEHVCIQAASWLEQHLHPVRMISG